MPRILRIINRFNLGGPTYNVAYLSKFLAPEFETMLVGGMKEDSEESSEFILKNLGIKPIIIPEMRRSVNLLNDFSAYQKIKQLIKDFKPDIVHTHASKAGAIGRFAAIQSKVPVIVHTFHGSVFHSYFDNFKTTIYKTIERHLAKKSSAIIAVSEKQKQELSLLHKICEPEKIHVIPLGFDLLKFQENQEEKRKNFRQKIFLSEDEIAIGIIGRIVPVKNHELFLRSLKIVKEKTSKKIKAFIIGDGEDRKKMEQLAENLNLNSSAKGEGLVVFTSWIKEIDWAIAGMDIIALTSLNEGTPVSLVEAQAANKPIVTTQVGGAENIVIPDVTALLAENNNEKDFAEKLLRLIEDAHLRMEMSKHAWQQVKEKFHYTRLVNDFSKLYHSLLLHK